MRAAGPSLGEYVKGKIYRGLLTGLNEAWIDPAGAVYIKGQERPRDAVRHGVFLISGAEREKLIAEDRRSSEIIKPLAQGRDISRWNVDVRDAWLILTKVGVPIERYPAILRHLKRFEKPLRARQDQGEHWWELRACAYYDEFEKARIAYQEIATFQAFTRINAGVYVNAKVFFIPVDDLYLLGVLNSRPSWAFLNEIAAKMVGGAFAMQTPYVNQIPIPTGSAADRSSIAALAQKCLDARGVGCEAWEKEIDERVTALYGL